MKRGSAVVTGGAGHLGRAIGAALAQRGMSVMLSDVTPERVQEAIAAIEAPDGTVRGHVADVTDEHSVAGLVEATIDAFGEISVVVNNAGVEGPVVPTDELSLDEARFVYEVNAVAVLAVIKHTLPHLRRHGAGRIINIASGAGISGAAFMATYNSSKHAVIGITRSVAREVAPEGIAVNAVCPGCIESPMMDRIEQQLAKLRGVDDISFVSSIPMGRYATPTEVAGVVAYLALDAPTYLTGTTVLVDGGLYA